MAGTKPNQTSFKPGQTGNPKGRPPKGTSLTDVMREFLEEIPEGQERNNKELFVQKSYDLAMKGDPTFAKLVWNYLDGMPQQKIDHTSKDEKIQGIVVTVMDPNGS